MSAAVTFIDGAPVMIPDLDALFVRHQARIDLAVVRHENRLDRLFADARRPDILARSARS